MKDKNVAGIFALFLGWLGIHRFYLGQVGLGILYIIFFWFPLFWLISLIDAIVFFSMDRESFDRKYNKADFTTLRQQPDFERSHRTDFERRETQQRTAQRPIAERPNQYKQSGLEKFRDFDYAGAIGDFKKSLEIAPQDIATHFNIACAYSLIEDAKMAYFHLDKAVVYGFRDFQKIKQHHALAYLRIQQEFDDFEENGFRLAQKPRPTAAVENLLASQPDLLDQLKKLGALREKGLLTEQEFADQKKRLMGS